MNELISEDFRYGFFIILREINKNLFLKKSDTRFSIKATISYSVDTFSLPDKQKLKYKILRLNYLFVRLWPHLYTQISLEIFILLV